MVESSHLDRVKELKSLYTDKYLNLTDEALAQEIQAWIDKENNTRGYLIGLSPRCNINKLAEIMRECGECTSPRGQCSTANMLRNMAALEHIVQMISNKDGRLSKLDEAMELIENGYGPYIMLKEFAERNCKFDWHKTV